MNKIEILKGLNNGSITINFNGHCDVNRVGYKKLSKEFINDFDEFVIHELKYANGAGDNTWGSFKDEDATPEGQAKVNADMRDFYNKEIMSDHGLRFKFFDWNGRSCWNCGKRIFCYINNDKREVLVATTYKSGLLKDEKVCEFTNPQPFQGEIDLSTVVVVNYFKEDCDRLENDVEDYYGDYSLNCLAGRQRTAKWMLDNQKRAYGQMGNMSIGVYLSKTKDHIIISSAYLEDHEDSYYSTPESIEQAKHILANYDYKGCISLCVWRYEVADIKNITLTNEDIEVYKENHKKGYMSDHIVFDVTPGKYLFTHYYDLRTDATEPLIYGEFKLIK